ncbi:MAG: leucine-rich repeat domain-containing protein [Clostridia bacterium]|nr:leucine-rich repeat domain-containing protein [Clostridia bacterium]
MKKKIFLMLAVMAMLVCVFAISVSAATVKFNGQDYTVTTYENVKAKTNIDVKNINDVVIFSDGFCCPTAYVFKDQNYVNGHDSNHGDGKYAFDFGFINGERNKEYTFADILKLDIPQGVVKIGHRAFQDVTTLVEVSIPSSVTTIEGCAFEKAAGLKRCIFEHGEDDGLTNIPSWVFSDCTSLEALSIPDCVTTIDGYQFLTKCSNLTAVYLSKNLSSFSYTNGDSNRGPFNECKKMYLVNEPFSYDSIPAKPEVYYFPSGLSSDVMTGTFFRNCASLNKVLVFGTGVTAMTNNHFFEGCGNETVVFLGDMTQVSATSSWPWSTKNIYFANVNDKSAADLTLSIDESKQTAYFCHAADNTAHLSDPRKAVITKEPNCVDNAWSNTYCFCGAYMGEVEIPNSNNGGAHDLENATIVNIVYSNFTAAGTKALKCPKCGVDDIAGGEAPALFTCLGYSAPENGNGGIAVGFTVNGTAITEYEAVTNKTVSYGIFAALKDRLNGGDIFADGNVNPCAIVADVTAYANAAFEVKIVGFETDTQKTAQIALGAYVKVSVGEATEYTYLQHGAPEENEKYCFASFNQIAGSAAK